MTLFEAYAQGLFPWPQPGDEDGGAIPLYAPDPRGVLDFDDLHVPRSLEKILRRTDLVCTLDRDFVAVMEACAGLPRRGQQGTWITPQLKVLYEDFHRAGHAHSLEVWLDGQLVGGIYGVYVLGVFSGESLFHLRPNMGKVALIRLVEFLRAQGLQWMDIQMVTPALQALGGKWISAEEFSARLRVAQARAVPIRFVM